MEMRLLSSPSFFFSGVGGEGGKGEDVWAGISSPSFAGSNASQQCTRTESNHFSSRYESSHFYSSVLRLKRSFEVGVQLP